MEGVGRGTDHYNLSGVGGTPTHGALGRARDHMYMIFRRYFIQPNFQQFAEILVTVFEDD